MLVRVIQIARLLIMLAGGHRSLVFENLALRQQLAVYHRTRAKPTLGWFDRLFWVGLRLAWPDWQSATPQGDELGILLKGDLAAMLAAARKTKRPSESDDLSLQVSLVAGAGCRQYRPRFMWSLHDPPQSVSRPATLQRSPSVRQRAAALCCLRHALPGADAINDEGPRGVDGPRLFAA
jgi:hypothetical protein